MAEWTFEFDEPVQVIEKARQPAGFTEIGRTGLMTNAGYVQEEFLLQLAGDKAISVYKEMRDNDPVIGAVMMALLNLVRQAKWTVEPYDDSATAKADAEFVEESMNDMDRPWLEFISEAMSMVVFGWSFFETVYKYRDGKALDTSKGSRYNDNKIGWRKLGTRSQDSLERWEFADNGDIIGMWQRAAPDYRLRYLPLKKGVLFRTSSWKDNPEGRSILRNAYRIWFFKKRMEEIEGIGVERDLNGIPVAYVPPTILRADANPDERATLATIERMVKNVRNDSQAGLVLPALYDDNSNKLFSFELLTTLGRRNFDTNAIINRMNMTMAASMLADFVLVGQQSVGSFAMASSKTKVFSVAIGSYMDTISDQFNRVMIPRLFAMNGIVKPELPQLLHGDIETVDLDMLAQYINALSGAGIDLTGRTVMDHLAAQAGIPPKALEEKPMENQPFLSGTSTVGPGGMKPSEEEEDATNDA